jgi:class 3 adenylate cyclase
MLNAPRVRFPIASKLSLAFALLAALPLVGLGAYVVDLDRTTLRVLSQHLQGAVGDSVAGLVDDELRGAEDALEGIGRILLDATLDEASTTRLAEARLSGESRLDHVVAYDARGQLLVALAEDDAQTAVRPPDTLSPELRTAADHADAAMGAAAPSESGMRVLLVVPLHREEEVAGYLASMVALDAVDARIAELQREHFAEVPDAILLTDARGHVLANGEGSLDGADAAARAGVLSAIDAATGAAWSGRFDAPGGERLGTMRPVGARALRVITQVPLAIAFASIAAVQRAVAIAVLVAILVAVLLGILLARGITAPVRTLVGLAADLGARRFDRRASVGTGDELAVLGHAMSEAARGLEESEKAIRKEIEIRTDLGRYLPSEIVDRVVAREQDMALGGTARTITVLFADVVGFTPLAAKLKPEATVAILNELFSILTEIVFRHGGTVDKFVGDSVMAIWNAPAIQDDHAARALRAAEEMLRWLEAGNAGWREKYGVTIELAIGVNTGEAVVGNIGSDTRMEYTAIGDTVNVAARLEALARPQQILVTAATRDAAKDEPFDFYDGGMRELAGRREPVHVFEVSA